MERLDAYLRIREAAEFLGVSPNTLRNWGREDKIAEFQAQLANANDTEKEELEKELIELRSGDSERLQAIADKVAKTVADLTKLEASAQSHLTAANDAMAKLSFGAAGAVGKACRTLEIDRLGGIMRAMPRTGLAFVTGAAAICGLPPLNGFVSELLVYMALLAGCAVLPVGAQAESALAFAESHTRAITCRLTLMAMIW